MRTLATTLFLSALFALSGCVHDPVDATQPVTVEHVYFVPQPDIERAIKQVMVKYPQKIDNLEAGIFETDYVKGDQRWKPPGQNPHYGAGFRYRIVIHLLKGFRDKNHPAVKVVISKVVEEQADFFRDADNKVSDGLEERTILYRIQRELTMEKAAQHLQEQQNQDSRQNFQQ